jgi:hypothetical protein
MPTLTGPRSVNRLLPAGRVRIGSRFGVALSRSWVVTRPLPGTSTGSIWGVGRDHESVTDNGGEDEHHRPRDGFGAFHRLK